MGVSVGCITDISVVGIAVGVGTNVSLGASVGTAVFVAIAPVALGAGVLLGTAITRTCRVEVAAAVGSIYSVAVAGGSAVGVGVILVGTSELNPLHMQQNTISPPTPTIIFPVRPRLHRLEIAFEMAFMNDFITGPCM
jgi:hypothetical protein